MDDMTPKRFDEAKREMTSPALEVVARLYRGLLNMPPFKLFDGTPVAIKSYQPPAINKQGEAECGVDVLLPNGHLEIMLRNTGWGKSFADEIAKRRTKRERQR